MKMMRINQSPAKMKIIFKNKNTFIINQMITPAKHLKINRKLICLKYCEVYLYFK